MNERLLLELAKHLALGRIPPEAGLPALRELLTQQGAEPASSLAALSEELRGAGLEHGPALREAIQRQLCREAREAATPPAGIPPETPRGWQDPARPRAAAQALGAALRRRAALEAAGQDASAAERQITERRQALLDCAHPLSQLGLDATLLDPALAPVWAARLAFEREEAAAGRVPAAVLDEEAFLARLGETFTAAEQAEQRRLLDLLLTWPTAVAAPAIVTACRALPWAQERACQVLSYRLQSEAFETWPTAVGALFLGGPTREQRRAPFAAVGVAAGAAANLELSLLYASLQEPGDEALVERLAAALRAQATPAEAAASAPAQDWLIKPAEGAAPAPAAGATPLVVVTPRDGSPAAETPEAQAPATTRELLDNKRRRAGQAPADQPVAQPVARPAAFGWPTAQPVARPAAFGWPTAQPTVQPVVRQVGAAGAEAVAPLRVANQQQEPPRRRRPIRPPAPPTPSVWDEHLRPLLVENWYMVVGLAMVLVGASLLAYFTWDKSPLLRYSVMPAMLLGFTLALGEAGHRMGRAKAQLRGTALLLMGAAVALIPLNFAVVDLALGDANLPANLLVGAVLGVIYLSASWLALNRWSEGVAAGSGLSLALPFVLLNALHTLLPVVAQGLPGQRAAVLALGAYAGFGVLAWAVRAFCRDVLTPKLLEERLTYLFVGGALLLTFLEGVLWSHVAARAQPLGAAYSLLVILAGGLVLWIERAFLTVAARAAASAGGAPAAEGAPAAAAAPEQRAESFLGFALILLGLLLGMPSPTLRVASFGLAGAIWLRQATRRPGHTHHAIGVTLLLLGGCSLALVPNFPRLAWPLLGLLLCGGLRGLRGGARLAGNESLSLTAGRFEAFTLALTAVVTVLAQWHDKSSPLVAGAALVIVGAVFMMRALAEERLDWVHVALALFALALPYLGCADMQGRELRGNTMVFGLGFLAWVWLGMLHATRAALLLRARSSGVLLLGALACAAMALRVLVEGSGIGDAPGWRLALDLGGPLLVGGALLVATYCSRSLVPALFAAAILAVLLPGLRVELRRALPFLDWGSGRGAAVIALALTGLCFWLQRLPSLRDLEGGDRILDRWDFPLLRRDASLFTLPLGLAAAFLALKGLLVDLPRNYARGAGVPPRTAQALVLHALDWVGLAALLRRHALSPFALHLGIVSFTAAVLFSSLGQGPSAELPAAVWLLSLSGATLLLEHLALRAPWTADVLLVHVRRAARGGAWLIALATALACCGGARPHLVASLALAACAWHALTTNQARYGLAVLLLAVPWLFALGYHDQATRDAALSAGWRNLVALGLGVQALMLALEHRRALFERAHGLLAPLHHGTSVLALPLGVLLAAQLAAGHAPDYARPWQGALLALLCCVARGQRSGTVAFFASGVAYLMLHGTALTGLSGPERLELLRTPSHLALWALGVGAAVFALYPAGVARRTRFRGSFPLTGELLSLAGLCLPTLGLALLATLVFSAGSYPRAELCAPYLSALAVALLARGFLPRLLRGIACVLLATANTHLVHQLVVVPYLSEVGISGAHVVCLGLLLTLVQGSVARRLVPREGFDRYVNVANVALAGTVLGLLAVHYVAHPDLAKITTGRFVISGLLAVAAGLYFRRAARNPRPPFAAFGYQLEGLYHFGLSMGLWCLFLLVPALRHPGTALIALGAAPLYFYLRAEYGERIEDGELGPIAVRYRDSAIVLGFCLMGLYAAQGVFQLILFPDVPPHTFAYHVASPVLLVVSFGLMRLRGLGGSDWLTLYGALGLVAGTFFAVSAIPGLSPFTDPVPAAWLGLAISHFFAVATSQPSPLRTFIQWIGDLDDEGWTAQRTAVGALTLAATCLLAGLGMLAGEPRWVAPLLLGLATIFAHHAAITGFAWQRTVTALLVLAGLHTGFFIESWLPAEAVRWVLLGLWLGLILGYRALRRLETAERLAELFALIAFLLFAQVLYFHPESRGSLVAAAAGLALAAGTPVATTGQGGAGAGLGAGWGAWLLLGGLPWLAYFGASDLRHGGSPLAPWPLYGLAACVVGQAFVVQRWAGELSRWLGAGDPPRLLQQALAGWSRERALIQLAGLSLGTVTAVLATLQLTDDALPPPALAVACVLWAALAVSWYLRGRERQSLGLVLLGEACALVLLWLVRRQLHLTVPAWTHEHDVWASIALTALVAGSRELVGQDERETRQALIGSLVALPLLALVWARVHHLPSELTLAVLGIDALIFTFLGRGDRRSPFHLVGVVGFTAFVLVLFWTQLELRTLQAYVIPVSVGVLILLQLLGDELAQETRQRVQGAALLAMVASSAYYAVFDPRHPLAYNATLIGVGLAAMGAGTLLRVRLYLALGAAGVLLDLVSIAWKVVTGLGHAAQVTTLGLLLLLAGVTLVVGSASYKSNKEEFDLALDRFRARFADWS
ncbi:MAG: hypothetical protein AB7N76_01075 [Planctomycetota bacterium]